jgi:hypothetical protein
MRTEKKKARNNLKIWEGPKDELLSLWGSSGRPWNATERCYEMCWQMVVVV